METNNQTTQAGGDNLFHGLKIVGTGNELPVTETKAEETKPEDSSLKTEAANETAAETKGETTTEVNTGVENESAAAETTTTTETTEAVTEEEWDEMSLTEIVEQINKQISEDYGFSSFEEARAWKSIDFTNHGDNGVSEYDTIAAAMRLDDPGITDREIEAKLFKFNRLFDENAELSEEEELTLNAEFDRMLRDSEVKLTEDQAQIDLDQYAFRLGKKQQAQKEESPVIDKSAVEKALAEAITNELKPGEEKVFSILDANGKEIANVKYTVADTNFQRAMEAGKQGSERWKASDGSFDQAMYAKEMFILENFDNILAAVYGSAKAAGAEAQVKDINNIDFTHANKAAPEKGSKSIGSQLGWV